MASMTDHLENALRDHVLLATAYTAPATVYLALFTTATGDDGTGTEVTGGSYARQPVDFDAGGTGIAVSAADVTFAAMPAATVTHVALFDAVTAGNMLLHGPLTTPKTLTAGTPLTFPAGDIDASFT